MKKKGVNINDFVTINEMASEVPREKPVLKPVRTPVRSPLIVVKRNLTHEDIEKAIAEKWDKTDWLENMTDTNLSPTRLYKYQKDYINDPHPFRHIDKSRQVGASYIFACEGLVNAMLMPRYTQIFISINQEEAGEKIVYARDLYDSMDEKWPLSVKRPLVFNNKKLLEFEVQFGSKKSRTRIISHAQREPRGKGGNTFVVLDECAHYMFGDQIYIAALPITSRDGGMTLASTPLGKTGIHWMTMEEPQYRSLYSYHRIMWWDCPIFVKDKTYAHAQLNAPSMETVNRVREYGSPQIQNIFIGMDIESFKQEYECHHIDESVSYFPMSLIKTCCYTVIEDNIFMEEEEDAGDIHRYPLEEKNPKIDFSFFEDLDEFILYARANIKGGLYAGFDVGRKHHSAELFIFEDHPSDILIARLKKTYRNEDFETMKGELRYALNNLDIVKLGIDDTGLGANLAEDLTREYPGTSEGITFTNQWKEEVATNIRCMFEAQMIAIPDKREITGQIHSIKRIVTEHGNLRLDAEKNKDHHGDIFWAIALACNYIKKAFAPSLSLHTPREEDDPHTCKFPRPASRIISPSVPLIKQVNDLGTHFDPRRRRRND